MKRLLIFCGLIVSLQFVWSGQASSKNLQTHRDFSSNRLLMGYMANIPKQPLGFYFCTVRPQTIGFYLSLHVGIPAFPPDNQTYRDISIHKAENIFGDQFLGEEEYTSSISIGITKTLTKDKAFYIAPSLTWIDTYREYYDEFEILGKHGNYLIEGNTETQLNLMVGLIFIISQKSNSILGISAQPLGGNLGIGFTF